jgi:hypothetical protein
VPDEHLARVDADSQVRDGLPQLRCGAYGAQRVILVHGGDAENAEKVVACPRLDRAPMPLDRGPRLAQRLHCPAAQPFGIEVGW